MKWNSDFFLFTTDAVDCGGYTRTSCSTCVRNFCNSNDCNMNNGRCEAVQKSHGCNVGAGGPCAKRLLNDLKDLFGE